MTIPQHNKFLCLRRWVFYVSFQTMGKYNSTSDEHVFQNHNSPSPKTTQNFTVANFLSGCHDLGTRIACWLECQTHDWKIASSNLAGAAGEFSSPESTLSVCVLTLIRCPFHPCVTAVACKRLGHSAKSAGVRIHLNTHTPLTHQSRSGLTIPLSRQSVGIYQETSSHATRQGTLGYSHLSSLSHCRLILA